MPRTQVMLRPGNVANMVNALEEGVSGSGETATGGTIELRVLVLGANGFIGTHLVDALLEKRRFVRIYSRNPNRFRATPRDAEYVEGELGNYGLIQEAVKGIEIVYHFVSTTLPKTSNDDPIYDVRSNLIDTLQLLEACVDAGVRKVIFASSGGTVYGLPQMSPIPEDHPTNPITSYGVVKLAIEKYMDVFRHLHDLDYAVLRISNPYGPYQDPGGQQGAISVFLHHLRTGQPITIWGDGKVVRDYMYVSDLVDALVLAAEIETGRKVLNVGSGHGTSLNELIALMDEVTGERPEVEYLAARALDVPANVLDITRVREELGWRPRITLNDGIARTWNWIKSLHQ
jgi:UDP-glucose 4-epimerase